MAEPDTAKLSAGQRRAYRWGVILALIALVALLLPGRESWHAAGPGNVGHQEIECQACHLDAPGSLLGQVFTNTGYWLGIAEAPTYFAFAPAGNRQCLDCHQHDDDRHPVARFLEPEFATAREQIGAQECANCHRQHEGVRVTAATDFCRHCHTETTLEEDPLDVPHRDLIEQQRWKSCLGCHDFHGNHEWQPPTMVAEVLGQEQIFEYFRGGTSPYGQRRLTVMQTMRQEGEDDDTR